MMPGRASKTPSVEGGASAREEVGAALGRRQARLEAQSGEVGGSLKGLQARRGEEGHTEGIRRQAEQG
jgi:hypothetical protein